jgi:hypothetical protein
MNACRYLRAALTKSMDTVTALSALAGMRTPRALLRAVKPLLCATQTPFRYHSRNTHLSLREETHQGDSKVRQLL